MFNGVVGGGYEIVCGVGCTRFPGHVAGAQGIVIRLGSKVHGIVCVEGVTCGDLYCGREKAAIASGETSCDEWWGIGIEWWLA